MADDEFTRRFVSIFDRLHADLVDRVDSLPRSFDPSTAPIALVRLLAAWTCLQIPAAWEDDQSAEVPLRRFVSEGSPLFRWRGTRRGLEALLRSATGRDVTVSDTGGVRATAEWEEGDRNVAPRVRVEIAGPSPSTALSLADVEALVRTEIPVGVDCEIVLDESSEHRA